MAHTRGGLFSGVVAQHSAPPMPLRKSPKSAAEGTSGGVLDVPPWHMRITDDLGRNLLGANVLTGIAPEQTAHEYMRLAKADQQERSAA